MRSLLCGWRHRNKHIHVYTYRSGSSALSLRPRDDFSSFLLLGHFKILYIVGVCFENMLNQFTRNSDISTPQNTTVIAFLYVFGYVKWCLTLHEPASLIFFQLGIQRLVCPFQNQISYDWKRLAQSLWREISVDSRSERNMSWPVAVFPVALLQFLIKLF